MVVFTCNHCGDSLQKPKVEKHYFTVCRRAKALTCVDCLKDFMDEEYVAHTKCVTEEERYAAKGSFNKGLTKKGEAKQESWMDFIQSVIANTTDVKPSQQHILTFLSNSTNVPRKKIKFTNFIKSALARRASDYDIDQVWDIIEKHKEQQKASSANDSKPEAVEENGTQENTTDVNESSKKKKKRKNADVDQNAEEKRDDGGDDDNKTKPENGSASECVENNATAEPPKKKKKKSKKATENGNDNVEANAATTESADKDVEINNKVEAIEENVNNDINSESAKKKKKKSKKVTENGNVSVEANVAASESADKDVETSDKVEASEENVTNGINSESAKKKKRKSKNSQEENGNLVSNDIQPENEAPKKKKKKTENGVAVVDQTKMEVSEDTVANGATESTKSKKRKLKAENNEGNPGKKAKNGIADGEAPAPQQENNFNYKDAILEILKVENNINLLTLETKFLDAYQKAMGAEHTPKVTKKFKRLLKKINGVQVSADSVQFVES